MNKNNAKEKWIRYTESELAGLNPMLGKLGFVLEDKQIHIAGERHLMSGYKIVLNGSRQSDNERVIIKASSQASGVKEIKHDHAARRMIKKIEFAYRNFLLPNEILFTQTDGFVVSITEFIEQKKSFFEHDLAGQFFLSLRALQAQEGTHVTTSSHLGSVKKVFGFWSKDRYLESAEKFKNKIVNTEKDEEQNKIIENSFKFLKKNRETLEKYSNFLTHSDFVPHNLRVVGHDIYLLDHTSIIFGNKYESWARFINYMTVYNPELELALMDFVKDNRAKDEYLSLRLMRAYKLLFLIDFYTNALNKTEGSLKKLTKLRIGFWIQALKSILHNKQLKKERIEEYKKERDALRSEDEIIRQKSLNQLPN